MINRITKSIAKNLSEKHQQLLWFAALWLGGVLSMLMLSATVKAVIWLSK